MKAKIKRVKFDESVTAAQWLELKKTGGFTDLLTESTGRDNIPNGADCHSLGDYSSASVADNAYLVLLPGLFKALGYRFELKGKLALVIGGKGAIGAQVVKRGAGFGMNMIDFDIYYNNDTAELLLKILERAELIFICIPLNSETKSYFKKKHYEVMKKKPMIINVSGRNELLDSDSLGHHLLGGLVRGYASDSRPVHWIAGLNNTFFCVHSGSRTIEADARKIEAIKEKLEEIVEMRKRAVFNKKI